MKKSPELEINVNEIEETIRKKHVLSWEPKFKEEFHITILPKYFSPLTIHVIEKLGWEVSFREDDFHIEAKCPGKYGKYTEKIEVSISNGKVNVKSTTLGNQMYDWGTNSLRVKLFIKVFKKAEKELSRDQLDAIETSQIRVDNMDDYEVPEKLPAHSGTKTPNKILLFTFVSLSTIITGVMLSVLQYKIPPLTIALVLVSSILVAWLFKICIKTSNYTNYDVLDRSLLIASIGVLVVSKYTEFILVSNEFNLIKFFNFIVHKLENKQILESFNTGWIGIIISWGIQITITYLLALVRFSSYYVSYKLSRVPVEVIDYVFYLFLKEKTEEQVRDELAKKGWVKKQAQDEAIEAVGGLLEARELARG